MSFLSKLLDKFAIGRKFLTWKARIELRSLEERHAQLSWELAELGSEISRRKGFMKREGARK